ncbi:hypothetical protein PTKIN_Ptkin09bG0286400 [Pterospermum kingtungense]
MSENGFGMCFGMFLCRDYVLENGPWHVQNRPLLIRKWEPGMKTLDLNLQKVPIWVHLWNVPLELFSQQGLSYISSVLGVPLYMDKFTANQERLAFAKVCVLIDASKEIPAEIGVKLRGVRVQVRVEVPWIPLKCSNCVQFGHSTKTCINQSKVSDKNSIKQKWVPKDAKVANSDDVVGNSKPNQSLGVGNNRHGIEGYRKQGKAGSVGRFSILMEEKVDKEKSVVDEGILKSKDSEQPSTVAALMDSIKVKVQETIAKRKFDEKGKGIVGLNPTSDIAEIGQTGGEVTPVQSKQIGVKDNGNSSLLEDDGKNTLDTGEVSTQKTNSSVMDDLSSDDEDGLRKKKLVLPVSTLVRKPRLASLGVSDAIAAVKNQTKKCRRQARKASAKKN